MSQALLRAQLTSDSTVCASISTSPLPGPRFCVEMESQGAEGLEPGYAKEPQSETPGDLPAFWNTIHSFTHWCMRSFFRCLLGTCSVSGSAPTAIEVQWRPDKAFRAPCPVTGPKPVTVCKCEDRWPCTVESSVGYIIAGPLREESGAQEGEAWWRDSSEPGVCPF